MTKTAKAKMYTAISCVAIAISVNNIVVACHGTWCLSLLTVLSVAGLIVGGATLFLTGQQTELADHIKSLERFGREIGAMRAELDADSSDEVKQ